LQSTGNLRAIPAVHRGVSDPTASAPRPLKLSGYHGEPTPARLLVATFNRPARTRRALKGLGGFWGAMVVSIFIPIAHFVLVPTFFFVGIWQFLRRLRTRELVKGAHGRCPDCGAEQDFELLSRRLPQSVTCGTCHRGLTLAEAA
jgi:hypothetical protein